MAFVRLKPPILKKLLNRQILPENPSFGQFHHKIDSNDFYGLISTQFSTYQNFRTLFIIINANIFFERYFCRTEKRFTFAHAIKERWQSGRLRRS